MSERVFPSPETVSALLSEYPTSSDTTQPSERPQVLSTVLHGLALILTSFRLWFRYHIRRLGWDDVWAALALVCDAVCMATAWTLTAPADDPYINFEAFREQPPFFRWGRCVSHLTA